MYPKLIFGKTTKNNKGNLEFDVFVKAEYSDDCYFIPFKLKIGKIFNYINDNGETRWKLDSIFYVESDNFYNDFDGPNYIKSLIKEKLDKNLNIKIFYSHLLDK